MIEKLRHRADDIRFAPIAVKPRAFATANESCLVMVVASLNGIRDVDGVLSEKSLQK